MEASNSYIRKQLIIQTLLKEKSIEVNKLSEELHVTPATIRNDLTDLQKRGLLMRTHGGAVVPEDESLSRNFINTINEKTEEKMLIAKEASKLVKDGDTIILDGGSTTTFLAKCLRDKKITVLTNNLPIIEELITCPNIEIIVIGGVIRRASYSFIGSFGNSALKSFNVDTYFLGATNFDIHKGISSSNIVEGQSKQEMLKVSSKVCFIADSSKGNKSSLFQICDWSNINYFITDDLPEEDEAYLYQQYHLKAHVLSRE